MSFDDVPFEMRQFPQWGVWKYEHRGAAKLTKVPYNARTGAQASVIRPTDWLDYNTAVNVVTNGWADGTGFCLTDVDPFAVIDLDDPMGDSLTIARHNKMIDTFASYTEISPSKRGVHIWVKGTVPSGRKRYGVEVYSKARFMTVTGDVIRPTTIQSRQAFLDILYRELGGSENSANSEFNGPQIQTDEQVYHMAASAANSALFNDLWAGNWEARYPSQSEADQAFINILAVFSDNRDQIARLFHYSALGKRDKAKRPDYLQRTISLAFDNKYADVQLENMRQQMAYVLEQKKTGAIVDRPALVRSQGDASEEDVTVTIPEPEQEVNRPPGLLGEIAQFIYDQAPRPVAEIALTGAIGLMAGICGQAYNVGTTGLNQYVLLLAPTGTGKEQISSGISVLMSAVTRETDKTGMKQSGVPAAATFLGPGDIASAPGLIKRLESSPSFVSIIGEVGLMLKRWCSENANSNDVMIRRALLDLYSKSGKGNVVRETVYSKKENNTEIINSPALTIVGETVPETFLEIVDEHLISQGLLPRFLIMEYRGKRVASSKTFQDAKPSEQLVGYMRQLCTYVLQKMHDLDPVQINISPEAEAFIDQFDKWCDGQINNSNREVIRMLWNRAHLKLLRLSGLVAVGCNPYAPTIELSHVHWSYPLIVNDINTMLGRFERGEVGRAVHDNSKQDAEVLRVCKEYLFKPLKEVVKYGVTEVEHFSKIIPYIYIQRRLSSNRSFRDEKMGSTFAIKRSLTNLVESGCLAEFIKPGERVVRGSIGAKYYIVTATELARDDGRSNQG